jgi:hypothetical protein
MESDFATKLRLTAAVLGCPGRKELCVRFRAANPATHFDLERSHKWLQGRALPRFAQVYEDWAKVLGTSRSGAWLASCTVDAFLDELCALYNADPEALRLRAQADEKDGPMPGSSRRDRAVGYLYGTYACYSMAWSPYYQGQIIRGALLLQPGGRTAPLTARYTEALLGKSVRFEGDAWTAGRTLHLLVSSAEHDMPLFITLLLPGPPATALFGIMSGATIVGVEPRPSATRIAVIRVPASASTSNRYMAPDAAAIADDLAALGLSLSEPSAAGIMIRDFLGGDSNDGLTQVSASEQERLASVLDVAYLDVVHASTASSVRSTP